MIKISPPPRLRNAIGQQYYNRTSLSRGMPIPRMISGKTRPDDTLEDIVSRGGRRDLVQRDVSSSPFKFILFHYYGVLYPLHEFLSQIALSTTIRVRYCRPNTNARITYPILIRAITEIITIKRTNDANNNKLKKSV